MAYVVTTEIKKAKTFFTDINDFEVQLSSERHQAVGDLLSAAEAAGDLISTTSSYSEDDTDYKGVIVSDWKDQTTYETYFNDAAAQEEINRIEAAGYNIVRSFE